jgi:hypothetical protein
MNDGGYLAISPLNSSIMVATGNVYNAAYYIGISHTSNGGTSWEHDTIPLGTRGWAVAFDGTDTNRVYVGGDSAYSYPALLISTNLGVTWTMSRSGLVGAVNALLTVPGVSGRVYAGTGNGVFRSTDGGATWTATSLTSSVRTLVADPVHPASLYAGTYGAGVYASTDAGATWTPMNTGLSCNKVLSLALRPGTENTIYAGTEGGSVFKTTTLTGVSSPTPHVPRPSSLAVSPNPCRSAATVTFASPLAAPALLRVYDASGCLVRSLHVRSSSFALRTSGLEPGTYFLRLTGPAQTRTARLTIVN